MRKTKFEIMAGSPRKNIKLLRAAQDEAAMRGDTESVYAFRGQIAALIDTLPVHLKYEYISGEKVREIALKQVLENIGSETAPEGQNVAPARSIESQASDTPRTRTRPKKSEPEPEPVKPEPMPIPEPEKPDDIIDLCSERWGRSPIWENPIELLNAFGAYKKWAEDNPVYASDTIRSGMMAGQVIRIPRKHLLTVEEFTSFIGAPSNYLDREKARHESDYREFGLDASLAFIEVIEKIKNSITDDTDRSAAAQLVDGTYVAKLRGFRTNMDYTSDGKAIQGGLTVEVISPRTTEKVNQLKAFKKTHTEKGKEG